MEPIKRCAILSLAKLVAESAPAERQTVLGWSIDTRQMLMAVPPDKYQAWSQAISAILEKGSRCQDNLETLVGQLNHAAHPMPIARHFIARLRRLLHFQVQQGQLHHNHP